MITITLSKVELLPTSTGYVPSFLPPPLASKGKESDKKREKENGKSRNIDHFMEELKHEQELRERRNEERENWHDADDSAFSSP